jgi:hypothetical protein
VLPCRPPLTLFQFFQGGEHVCSLWVGSHYLREPGVARRFNQRWLFKAISSGVNAIHACRSKWKKLNMQRPARSCRVL